MIGGTAISTSAPRISTSSIQPRKYPAASPIGTPIARLTAVALTPMASERRVPISSRLSTSRPYSSVPNQ